MSPAAVARELGISEGTLWKRMVRLREHFELAVTATPESHLFHFYLQHEDVLWN